MKTSKKTRRRLDSLDAAVKTTNELSRRAEKLSRFNWAETWARVSKLLEEELRRTRDCLDKYLPLDDKPKRRYINEFMTSAGALVTADVQNRIVYESRTRGGRLDDAELKAIVAGSVRPLNLFAGLIETMSLTGQIKLSGATTMFDREHYYRETRLRKETRCRFPDLAQSANLATTYKGILDEVLEEALMRGEIDEQQKKDFQNNRAYSRWLKKQNYMLRDIIRKVHRPILV
jgi:hypothetical protein